MLRIFPLIGKSIFFKLKTMMRKIWRLFQLDASLFSAQLFSHILELMQFSPNTFLSLFFAQLERLNIPYVILHSYENLPGEIATDVDFAVGARDLPKLAEIQRSFTQQAGGILAYSVESHIYSFYSVIVDPENINNFLQLDACGHYVEANCFFFSDEQLLKNRKRAGQFFIPAPSVEFAYLLVKALAKGKSISPRMQHLRELWQSDRVNTEREFRKLFGTIGGSLEEWFGKPTEEWEALRPLLIKRKRFGLCNHVREVFRAFRRMSAPTGLHIALLGPDGSGKSTLLDEIGPLLEKPFFRKRSLFHFRPKIFEQEKNSGAVTNPHGEPPRSLLFGIAKLFYYFLDHLIGYFVTVFPRKVRNELIFFDRNFDDLLVDPTRYRFSRAGLLAHLLARLLPRPDITFVLDASPELVHARKPELSLDELQRQRTRFRQLAKKNSAYVLVSADQAADKVAQTVCHEVVGFLASREKRRAGN